MAAKPKHKEITCDPCKRYPSEREALSDHGYNDVGFYSFKKIGTGELVTRRVYADTLGVWWTITSKYNTGYSFSSINLKEFTAKRELVK